MIGRREFLERLGAGFAFAAVASCTRAPDEKIFPYVHATPESTPGVARHYATAFVEEGYAIGLLAESHEGRPTKIEGNPRHPASLGGTSAIHQAWVRQLYDPGRARGVEQAGASSSREVFRAALRAAREAPLHVLLRPTSSPLVLARLARLREARSDTKVWFEPGASPVNAWEGARRAFGRVLEAEPDLRSAELIVAIDDDPLTRGPRALADARHFGERRRVRTADERPPRLISVEPALTCTGIAADARLRLRASDVPSFVRALLADVLDAKPNAPLPAEAKAALRSLPREKDARRTQLVHDLITHRSVVQVGASQPPEVHVLVHALNAALSALIALRPSPIAEAGEASFSHRPLLDALDAGQVGLLVLSDVDPLFDAPIDEAWGARIDKAKLVVSHGNAHARDGKRGFSVPLRHGLESWGDARAFDGTLGILQPLIAPLWESLSTAELLAMLSGEDGYDDHAALRALHRFEEGGFERALQAGLIEGTRTPAIDIAIDGAAIVAAAQAIKSAAAGIELRFPLDPKIHDGRFADVPWLLELPDPITKLTWRNAARLSPATAKRFGVASGDELELTLHDRALRVPAIVSPGDADDVITLNRGWPEANASSLRISAAPHHEVGVALRRVGTSRTLAITQAHTRQEGRPIALHRTRTDWEREPDFAKEHRRERATLYKLPLAGSPLGNQWGMVVDMSACTGCSACVVACVAENNIATVGEEGVLAHREMHWLRIDRYDDGSEDDPRVVTQPMLCQHCEKAPCEYVCPVNATVHSPDGLNEQVYHRCVGTRFCSNNCPYKVRRFNWFRYQKPDAPERMVFNPDVTVRERGVMEKCTFCVQRLRGAELEARVEERPFVDGDARTACQEACPTGAIVFGSISDPKSAVSAARKNPRMYAVLDDLGTDPRVRYLAKIYDPPEGER